MNKFRDHKTFAKKVSKAIARRDFHSAKRIEEIHKPVVKLDHIIKERYPAFTDALRDLDDALSMLHLFANLPTNKHLPPATVATCTRLSAEWQHYVIRTGALRKSFLSIKGIYYQAEVNGQDIMWLVPYSFAQNVPVDVDFRIMHTFVEFYSTLVGFALFRLYTMEGLVYPPRFDKDASEKAGGLRAFSLETKGVGLITSAEEVSESEGKDLSKQMATLGAKIASLTNEEEDLQPEESIPKDDTAIDTFTLANPSSDMLPQPTAATSSSPTSIFASTTFYISRETPREPLEFLLRSFGCKRIGWDAVLGSGAFTEDPSDPAISHQVVDRPATFPPITTGAPDNTRFPGRIYVQPQYVWDCVNNGKLLPPGEYAPGVLLPPHLSPWMRDGAYDPTAPLADDGEEEEDEEEVEDGGMQVALGSDGEEEEVDNDEPDVEEAAPSEDEDDEDEKARQEFQRELEAEAAGLKAPAPTDKPRKEKGDKKKKKTKQEREEEEQKDMQKIMMSRRKRKLYEKMIYSNKKKEDEAENLRAKRRKLDKKSKKGQASN